MHLILVATTLLLTPARAVDQVQWVGDTKAQVRSIIPVMRRSPTGLSLVELARRMIGRKYTAFSLDNEPTEKLILDLISFDCFLFVEELLALIHSHSVYDFADQVRQLRYESGKVNYCYRNHYFSLWAKHAEQRGLIRNIAPRLRGTILRERPLSFMSSHPSSYRPMFLQHNKDCIMERERGLTTNQTYIPLSALNSVATEIRSGDIFGLVTSVSGLDVTHTGIIDRQDSRIDAIHSVPNDGVIRTKNFLHYAAKVPDVIGVSIYRPLPE